MIWFDLVCVCFQENQFLEFIFLIFPCLATTWKTSQRKLNSGQHRKCNFNRGKCFPFDRTGKHFPFLSLHTFFSNSQITVSLFSSTIGKQQQVHHFFGTIEALKSRSLSNHFRYLFSFIISFMFIFFSFMFLSS